MRQHPPSIRCAAQSGWHSPPPLTGRPPGLGGGRNGSSSCQVVHVGGVIWSVHYGRQITSLVPHLRAACFYLFRGTLLGNTRRWLLTCAGITQPSCLRLSLNWSSSTASWRFVERRVRPAPLPRGQDPGTFDFTAIPSNKVLGRSWPAANVSSAGRTLIERRQQRSLARPPTSPRGWA